MVKKSPHYSGHNGYLQHTIKSFLRELDTLPVYVVGTHLNCLDKNCLDKSRQTSRSNSNEILVDFIQANSVDPDQTAPK